MHLIRKTVITFCICCFVFSCADNKNKNEPENATRENPRDLSANLMEKDSIIWNAAFEDLDGNEVKISDYKGKVVLIDFWETWCGPCLQVFPTMDSLQNEYPEDFVILAVNLNSSDEKSDVIAFREGNDYDFNYLLDVNQVGSEIIEVGIPFKLYFDPQGYLIKSELGSSGREGDYRKTKAIIEEHKES